MFVDFNILNQLGSPSINSNTFANRPAAGQTGRLFVSIDTFEIYRDNGTTWDLIGGPGTSTVTGTGAATQVAYWTAAQSIGGSNNLWWDNTAGALGINTNAPTAELDVHGSGVMLQLNSTSATANSLLAFQRSNAGLWRIGDTYNGGANFFELHNTVLTTNAIEVLAASNEATFLSTKTYSTGNAIGIRVQHNLTIPNGVNVGLAALGGVNSNLNLTLGGSTTVANTGRQGLEGSTSISFTGAGTLTMTQGSTVRAFSALSSVYAFNGSAVGTITHLAGLRICFPDNVGSAVNITNNYALLINNQTTGTGTVTYTNRWGIYQEGASDLNYFAANTLIGSTVNNGNALQVTGNGNLTGDLTADAYYLNGMTAGNGALYWTSDRVTLANYNASGTVVIETGGGTAALTLAANQEATFATNVGIGASPTGTYGKLSVFGGISIKNDNNAKLEIGRYSSGIANSYIKLGSNSNSLRITDNNDQFDLLELTNAGNLGLGVIPSAWASGFTALQVENASFWSTGNDASITANAYYDGSNYRYIASSGASRTYHNTDSSISWSQAPSGTAGNAITFTQAMTLDASGQLLIGTSTSSTFLLDIYKAATNSTAYARIKNNRNRNSALQLETNLGNYLVGVGIGTDTNCFQIYDNNASIERARITSSGNLLIGTTTDTGYKLQVNGSAIFDDITAKVDLYLSRTSIAPAIVLSQSSIRIVDQSIGISNTISTINGAFQVSDGIKTGTPTTGTAATWKLGSRVAATVVVNTTEYIEVDIGGTLYKLATVT